MKTPPPFERAAPSPPDWLDGAALDEWRRVTPMLDELHLIKEADAPSLAAYCVTWGVIVDTSEIIRREGYTMPGTTRLVAHPLVGVRARAIDALRPLAAAFGLSPASESNLSTPPIPDSDDDPFAAPSNGYGS